MDRHPHKHPKTVPIRNRIGEQSSSSLVINEDANSSDIEGTFLPVAACNSTSEGLAFVNTKFTDDEDEDLVKVVDLQKEEIPPLFLLFPDLENKEKENLTASTSTTKVVQILMGKKADFSLLKPSKKLNPEQVNRLPPLVELSSDEHVSDDQELG